MAMVRDDLPFGEDTAERLMAIVRHPVISNSAYARNLPAPWMTLYELTRSDPCRVSSLSSGRSAEQKTEQRTGAAVRTEQRVTLSG